MSGKCGPVGKTLTAQKTVVESPEAYEQLGFERHWAQQEGRQMRGVAVVHGLAHGLRGAARPCVFDARDRGRLLLLRLRPVLGLLLGWSISRAAGLVFPNLPTAVPLWAAASGVAVSVGVGLFFGIWPASRAARLDPVEALRHE